jgi:hypothetical protein
MQTRMRQFLLSSAIFVAVSATPLFPQTFGKVTEHISYAGGAAIPAAIVSLTNVATNGVRTVASTDSGDYTFPAVPPGVYNIKGGLAAFKATGSNNVRVQVQQTVRLDFTLEVGQVTESVGVSASAQMLQTESGTAGSMRQLQLGMKYSF